jgi:hypothetical protein
LEGSLHFAAADLFFRVQSSESPGRVEREMGRKLSLDKVLDCFSLSLCANACVCIHSVEDEEDEENEGMALVSAQLDEMVKLKDFGAGAKTLAFHLEPKVKNFNTLSISEIHLQSMWRLLVFTGIICFFCCIGDADSGAQGVHALLWMCEESSEAHLQDGRYFLNLFWGSVRILLIGPIAESVQSCCGTCYLKGPILLLPTPKL